MTETQRSASSYRVKLYELDENNNWADKGTGRCQYNIGQEGEKDQLCILSEEEEGQVLLESNVYQSNEYQRQKDTLILWSEEDGLDLAISFQDSMSCQRIWDSFAERGMLKAEQDDVYTAENDEENKEKEEDEELDTEVVTDNENAPIFASEDLYKLPDPTLSNMESIINTMERIHLMHDKDRVARYILDIDYIEKLIPIFNECEDLEAYHEIFIIYNLLSHILHLNDQSIIEHVVDEDLIMSVMGILEYDPKTPQQKTNHRDFIRLKGSARDHLVELEDEDLIKEIDETFRLRYLYTVLTNHGASHSLLDTISGMLQQNNTRMIKTIQTDSILLNRLCTTITMTKTTEQRRDECIRFILHLCELAREMQVLTRFAFYRALAHHGLVDVLCFALAHKSPEIQKTSVHLLESLVQADIHIVRSQIVFQERNADSHSLLSVIIKECTSEDVNCLRIQYFHILKVLMETNSPPNSSGPDKEMEEFLTVLYEKHMKNLFGFIMNLEVKSIKAIGDCTGLFLSRDENDLCKRLMDLLTFTFKTHGFRVKYFLITDDFLPKIMQLTRSCCAHIKLFPIRFIRACLESKDEFYYTNFIKMNLFESIVRVTMDHKEKDNLVSAACFSLFEQIQAGNFKPMIEHLVVKFGPLLDTIIFTKTSLLQKLKIESTDQIDKSEKTDSNAAWSSSTMDKDEEDYFNGSDEEEESSLPPIDTQSNEPPIGLKRKHQEEEEDDTPFSRFASKKKIEKITFKRKHEEEQEEQNKKQK